MKKRLRKKLRLAEVRQFGFEVSFSLSGHHTEAEINQFLDSFILDVIEPRGLLCGGGGNKNWSFLSIRIADSRHQKVTANISCARCVIIQTSLSYRLARWRMPGIPTSSTVCGVALPSAKPRRVQGGYAGDIGAAFYDQVG